MNIYIIVTFVASIVFLFLVLLAIVSSFYDAIKYYESEQDFDEQEFCDHMIINKSNNDIAVEKCNDEYIKKDEN